MVVHHSELIVLRCSSGTIATYPVFPKKKKRAINCLEVLRARSTFIGLSSSSNTHTVYFHHPSRCHRCVSNHRDRIFWSIPFDQSTRASFWAIEKLCGIQREHIFFWQSFNIDCMMVPQCLRFSQPHDKSDDDLAIQLILNDLHEIRLGVKFYLG